MTRALEAPQAGSTEYVDEMPPKFHTNLVCHSSKRRTRVRRYPFSNLGLRPKSAAYSFAVADESEDLQARATWAIVELVKLAIDAEQPKRAKAAAQELAGLFEYSDHKKAARGQVRAGQLVLSGWLDYLAGTNDRRSPGDPELRTLVTPRGTWREILAARLLAERGTAPFSRWDWWEIETSASGRAQVMQLSSYIDRAEVAALALSRGQLPPAADQESASAYQRFLGILDEEGRTLSPHEKALRGRLEEESSNWKAAEGDRLAKEPLSEERIASLKGALREGLNTEPRLAAEIPIVEDVPSGVTSPYPILGLNFRVPRHYLVEAIFNQTYADPKDLGQMIARGFAEGEERRIVELLRSASAVASPPTAQAIRQQIEAQGREAEHYVLVTPYGGLMDIDEWYSSDFQQVLARVTHVEASALEEEEAILFDRRTALMSCRRPEEKEGLRAVEGTTVALGVFQDVQGESEPHVRIETGEFFVVWRNEAGGIFRFAPDASGSVHGDSGEPSATE